MKEPQENIIPLKKLLFLLKTAEEQLALAYQETASCDFLQTSRDAGYMSELVSYALFKENNGLCH